MMQWCSAPWHDITVNIPKLSIFQKYQINLISFTLHEMLMLFFYYK